MCNGYITGRVISSDKYFINNTTNEKFYIFELMHEDREGNITNFPLVVRENLAIEIIKKNI
ncbi:hypothetical protein [Thermobrachium celere]|uniref:hypothetical protein n=1 Tax=Thermobrachium celere TaxID=53422 RepID=UPI001942E92D|nr:hypothetical protein [Thermobrachium celere]GFR35781.1 hypothetical protein TCEA9_15930 [Thermobrachium celere]